MNTNGKSVTVLDVTDLNNQIIADGNQKVFSMHNYRKNQSIGQCVKCRSDYMKFAFDGYCQYCQQKVEFIVRERPHVLRRIQNQGGNRK